jgi:hypothetical protein
MPYASVTNLNPEHHIIATAHFAQDYSNYLHHCIFLPVDAKMTAGRNRNE